MILEYEAFKYASNGAAYFTPSHSPLSVPQRDGDFTQVRLTKSGNSWSLLSEGVNPAELRAVKDDWKLPLTISRSEVDKLMTGHWCQAGDLIVRQRGLRWNYAKIRAYAFHVFQ